MNNDMPLECVVEKDKINIGVGLKILEFATKNLEYFDEHEIIVNDIEMFAKEVSDALNEEGEDGSTPISRMFDKAIITAFENGALGVSLKSEQNDETGED